MTHPLTDETCENISVFNLSEWGDTGDGIKEDMRAAADWQLEQVIEWLKDELDYRSDIDPNLLSDLKKAMRPQEDNT